MNLLKKAFQPLFLMQVALQASIIPMILFAETKDYLLSFLVYFFTGCIGMSMTYHRLLSHRSWSAPRLFEIFGTLCGTWGLTGSSLAWCSVHREHHQKVDKPDDPHSPHYKSWWKVHWFSMFHHPNLLFMKDKIKDPFHLFIHKNYFKLQVLYVLLCFLLNPFFVISLYLFPAMLLWNISGSVNTIGHLFGYRNFDTKDFSKNNLILALLSWGEGLHNNHHFNPRKAIFRDKWFEIDLSEPFIRLLKLPEKNL